MGYHNHNIASASYSRLYHDVGYKHNNCYVYSIKLHARVSMCEHEDSCVGETPPLLNIATGSQFQIGGFSLR